MAAFTLLVSTNAAFAQPGAALDFDGVDDIVEIGQLQLNGSLTIEAWVKPDQKTDFSTIISNKTGGSENPGYSFAINTWNSNDGKLILETTGYVAETSNSVITWGVWQHIAVTANGSTAKFYVNGVEVPTAVNTVSMSTSNNDTKIGDIYTYFGQGNYDGQMDELRVWSIAKTQGQIAEQMNCEVEPNESGLLAYYRFNQGIDYANNTNITTLTATAGNIGQLNNFTLNLGTGNFLSPGGVTSGLSCVQEDASALAFDGYEDYVSIGDLPLTGAFTIEAWVKPSEKTDFSTILSNKTGGGENPGYTFSINTYNNSDRKLMLETYGEGAETNNAVITWGVWQHIAVTSNGTTAKFYVNGLEQFATENSVSLATSNNPTNIGDFYNYGGNGKYYGGMDELRVWNYAKTQNQIQDQMECAVDATETGLIAYYQFNQGIANGDNTGISSLDASVGNNGTFSNFALIGSEGNFITPGGVDCLYSSVDENEMAYNALGNVFPNPVAQGNAVRFSVNSAATGNLKVQIFNAGGQLVYTQNEVLHGNEQSIEVNCTELNPGIYLVQFAHEALQSSQKLFIQ